MQEHEEKEETKQADPQNIHHEDLALKTAAQYFGEELLPLLGITDHVRYVAPTEIVKLEAKQMYQDFNYISTDKLWIHLEFESDSVTRKDLKRFREYEATTARTFNVAVRLCKRKTGEGKAPGKRRSGFPSPDAFDVRAYGNRGADYKKPEFHTVCFKNNSSHRTGKDEGRALYVSF